MKNSFGLRNQTDAGRRGDRIQLFCCDGVHNFRSKIVLAVMMVLGQGDKAHEAKRTLYLKMASVWHHMALRWERKG